MERRLAQAGQAGVSALVVRAGDFFGGRNNASSMFAHGVVKAGQPVKSITMPVQPGAGHAWAYLPDLAKTMAMLAERDGPEAFETYHFAGHFDPDGARMICRDSRCHGPTGPARAAFSLVGSGHRLAFHDHAARDDGDALSVARDPAARQRQARRALARSLTPLGRTPCAPP
jgi:hypothetical protein